MKQPDKKKWWSKVRSGDWEDSKPLESDQEIKVTKRTRLKPVSLEMVSKPLDCSRWTREKEKKNHSKVNKEKIIVKLLQVQEKTHSRVWGKIHIKQRTELQ